MEDVAVTSLLTAPPPPEISSGEAETHTCENHRGTCYTYALHGSGLAALVGLSIRILPEHLICTGGPNSEIHQGGVKRLNLKKL